ncbi:MAG: DUF924 domain-containing protein [Cocleimonas sp.]|nr:DUF924 domain-containing protein [Cocleimonas sp.]
MNTNNYHHTSADILDFWYSDNIKKAWFSSTPELDMKIHARYEFLWKKAIQGKLEDWKNTADGCLALIIILDQFPLNMFRNTAQSFSSEQQAVAVCYHAIKEGFDQDIMQQSGAEKIAFLYMPLMHSERMIDQDNAVNCFVASGLEGNIRFAKHHREIIKKYGRFPHRNALLGRNNTAEESIYLASKEAFLG